MSYAIIKTGGKQFAVEDGQTLRIPSLEGKAGAKIDIPATLAGRVARVVVSAFPNDLKTVAKAAAKLPPAARERFAEVAIETKPESKSVVDAAFKR